MINNIIKNPIINSQLSLNILFHVTFLFIILSILFTQFINNIASEHINNEIKNYIDGNNLFKNTKFNLKKYISYNYYKNKFSKEDFTKKYINKQIYFYIFIFNIFLIIILCLFIGYLLITKSIEIDEIKILVLENILTFILVGIFEYLFFMNIALKYIPIQPHLLIKFFIDDFIKN